MIIKQTVGLLWFIIVLKLQVQLSGGLSYVISLV